MPVLYICIYPEERRGSSQDLLEEVAQELGGLLKRETAPATSQGTYTHPTRGGESQNIVLLGVKNKPENQCCEVRTSGAYSSSEKMGSGS